MGALTGQSIASSYEQLLHVDRDGGGNSTTLVDVKDGDNDTTFALQLATDHIEVNGKLNIDQDSNTNALVIDSESTDQLVLNFTTPATTTGTVLYMNPDSLTTGSAIDVYSNASSNSGRDLVRIYNDNADADNTTCLWLHQDGDDAHIEFAGAGGGGIKFNASAMSSSDANTLDDYEEGEWSPVLSDGTNAMTMNGSADTGYYTKVGNLVTVSGRFGTSSLNGLTSESVRITGLPFTIANAQEAYSSGAAGYGTGFAITAGHVVTFFGRINETGISLTVWDATTGTSYMTASQWTADGNIMIGFSYRAA